uniref:Uncharacterized protein n=1 Tax=Bracon brevicornis TaxID=1563983 RepID=A0A6V7JIE9_9HYME
MNDISIIGVSEVPGEKGKNKILVKCSGLRKWKVVRAVAMENVGTNRQDGLGKEGEQRIKENDAEDKEFLRIRVDLTGGRRANFGYAWLLTPQFPTLLEMGLQKKK